MSDPMEPLKKLCEQLEKVAKECGLELHTFAVLPNMEGGPHMVQAMMIFDDSNNSLAARHAAAVAGPEKDTPEHERIEDADEAAATNEAFEAMMKGQQKTEEELQMEDAARRAQAMAEDLMKGNLGGDAPEAEAS